MFPDIHPLKCTLLILTCANLILQKQLQRLFSGLHWFRREFWWGRKYWNAGELNVVNFILNHSKHKIIQFLTSFKPEISASVERGGYNWVRKWADPQTYSPPSRNNLQWHFFCLTTHCDWLHKLYFLLKRSHPNPKQTARLFFVICKVPKISNALIREIQALLDHEEKLDYLALMWVTYILDAFFDVDFLNFNERINKQSV